MCLTKTELGQWSEPMVQYFSHLYIQIQFSGVYISLKYMYSIMSVNLNSLPCNTKNLAGNRPVRGQPECDFSIRGRYRPSTRRKKGENTAEAPQESLWLKERNMDLGLNVKHQLIFGLISLTTALETMQHMLSAVWMKIIWAKRLFGKSSSLHPWDMHYQFPIKTLPPILFKREPSNKV